ncbi:MAG: FAD-binding oxidoreductase [Candidatus Thermoplasmatota archaeon]
MKNKIISKLEEIVGKDDISLNKAELYIYGFDASIHHHNADIVLRPESAKEVSEILKIANKNSIPIVPRGSGSGLSGQAVPIKGGIVLDMTKMNRIKKIELNDLYCIVEPGVVNDALNLELSKYKFWFPPTPGSGAWCTIGGMVATNASGMKAIKYGATRDYVLGLEVVLPNGKIVRVGTKTLKNSSGYQLEKLFIGSEGTLCVITEITLRLLPMPRSRAGALISFSSIKNAGEFVSKIISFPIIPAAIEIMDRVCIKAVNKTMATNFPEDEAILIIEVDGSEEEVKENISIIEKIGTQDKIEVSMDNNVIDKWLDGRKAVMPALSRGIENTVSVSLVDDLAMPISKLAETMEMIQKISNKYGIIIAIYGHAGDGNLHTKFLVDPTNIKVWKTSEKAIEEIYEKVLEFGGTVSGEHGIGISKAPYMQKERKDSIEIMKNIKAVIDKNNIMNPKKIFDWKGSIINYLRYPMK